MRRGFIQLFASMLAGMLVAGNSSAALAQTKTQEIDDALQNVSKLIRKDHVGYATVFDGNKYVQCRRLPAGEMRCEAAGAVMQPSLQRILTRERMGRLIAQGWVLDPSFGNFVQVFSATRPTSAVAQTILETLTDVYAADPADIEMLTTWVADVPCPPRNGPSQNLAGSVSDSPAMRSNAIKTCSYVADPERPQIAKSSEELIGIYGPPVTAEIQRLRINAARNVFAVFGAGIGYVQCAPDAVARLLHCEAQSAESWEALTSILTPDRVAYLHTLGYADPGRVPNYAKNYPFAQYGDAAVAAELLTILFEVYGYRGATKLKTTSK